uniref:Putative secreted protein n=1 Tax=Ixodes ricinus TaxID=34613 RepID=A0A6B0U3G3_IXORI
MLCVRAAHHVFFSLVIYGRHNKCIIFLVLIRVLREVGAVVWVGQLHLVVQVGNVPVRAHRGVPSVEAKRGKPREHEVPHHLLG